MPTLFTHPIPVLAASAVLGPQRVPPRLMLASVLFSLLPDADSIGFFQGVPYASVWGHRGLTHSLFMVIFAGVLGWVIAPWLNARRGISFLMLSGAVISHIALDGLTNGGLGVAVLWPWHEGRYFFPWRPIEVSPMKPSAFFSERGWRVLMSELKWIGLPAIFCTLVLRWIRKKIDKKNGLF